LVVAAVIAEFVIAGIHPLYDSILEQWGSAMANGAIALGIVGEVIFSRMDARIQTELRSRSNKQLATAMKEAGEANVRAAEAQTEAARLRAQFSWRTLAPQAAEHLGTILSMSPGEINIEYVDSDPEALYLAIQFSEVFEKANWQVAMRSMSMPGVLVLGIFVPDSPSNDTQAVRNALTVAGFTFSTEALTGGGVLISSGSTIDDAVILFIGSKPIPR
jgi:hypothetical protein